MKTSDRAVTRRVEPAKRDRLFLHRDTTLEVRISESVPWAEPEGQIVSVTAWDVNESLGFRFRSERGQVEFSLHALTLEPEDQRSTIR